MPDTRRPWRIIAAELALEQDVQRVLELSRELNEALQEQTGGPPGLPPAGPSKKTVE